MAASSHLVRWLLLATLTLTPALAGCFGDEPPTSQLAKPTIITVMPPTPPTTAREQATFNSSDPGLAVTTPWHVGDGWDYESNGTDPRYHTIRVVEERALADRMLYRIEETEGRIGSRVSARTTSWVDGAIWGVVNTTDSSGTIISYDPPRPLRFYRNATFEYNASGFDTFTGNFAVQRWFFYGFLEGRATIVSLNWGQHEAFKVVHEGFDGTATTLNTYWVSPDYANPLRYATAERTWTLVAVDEGGRRFGALQATN